MKKHLGLIILLLGAWLLRAAWYDPAEGMMARPFAVFMIVGGTLLFLEGYKQEIIAAIQRRTDDPPLEE